MSNFNYTSAFGRNLGLLSPEEQQMLRRSRVVVVGLGGAGGIYAQALARLGIGRFTLVDGDSFEMANFNRQMGGLLSTVGCNKARTLERQIHEVNPEAAVDVWETYLDQNNADAILSDADLVINGIEAFAISAHRLLFRKARALGLPVFFGFPLGFGAAGLIFNPQGMSAEEYFDWHDDQENTEQVCNLVLGTAPSALYMKYVDLRSVDLERHRGPSHIGGCLLCAGIMACEATRILLKRHGSRFAPEYFQFDPYVGRLKKGRLRWGMRGPWMQLKKRALHQNLWVNLGD